MNVFCYILYSFYVYVNNYILIINLNNFESKIELKVHTHYFSYPRPLTMFEIYLYIFFNTTLNYLPVYTRYLFIIIQYSTYNYSIITTYMIAFFRIPSNIKLFMELFKILFFLLITVLFFKIYYFMKNHARICYYNINITVYVLYCLWRSKQNIYWNFFSTNRL